MKFLVSVVCLAFSSLAYAALVMPVFTGSWFLNRENKPDVLFYQDGCSNNIYHYAHLSSDVVLVSYILSSLPNITTCKWSAEKKPQVSGEQPVSFPGSALQWDQIVAMNNTQNGSSPPTSMRYTFDCKDTTGTIKQYKKYTLYPAYLCSRGSRSVANIGCVTNPPLCEADVLGRDLKTTWFSSLGHVALADSNSFPSNSKNNMILEVLNNQQVVNLDTFQSFLDAAMFWGEVYSPISHPIVSLDQTDSIINVALSVLGDDVRYTILPRYSTGGERLGYVYSPLGMVFLKSTVIVPASLFHLRFLKQRLAFPNASFPGNLTWTQKNKHEKNVCSNVMCSKERLNQLLAEKPLNPGEISSTLDSFIKLNSNKQTSDAYIYYLAQKFRSNSPQRDILMQELMFQKPTELMGTIIANYEPSDADNVMPLIGSALILTKPLTKDKDELKSIIAAQKLILNILKNSNNKEEVNQTIKYMFNIFPETTQYFELAASAQKRVGTSSPSRLVLKVAVIQVLNMARTTNESYMQIIADKAKQFGISESELRTKVSHVLEGSLDKYSSKRRKKVKQLLKESRPTCEGLSYKVCSYRMFIWLRLAKRVYHLNKVQMLNLNLKLLIGLKNKNFAVRKFLGRQPENYLTANPELLTKLKMKFANALVENTQNRQFQGALQNMRYVRSLREKYGT